MPVIPDTSSSAVSRSPRHFSINAVLSKFEINIHWSVISASVLPLYSLCLFSNFAEKFSYFAIKYLIFYKRNYFVKVWSNYTQIRGKGGIVANSFCFYYKIMVTKANTNPLKNSVYIPPHLYIWTKLKLSQIFSGIITNNNNNNL